MFERGISRLADALTHLECLCFEARSPVNKDQLEELKPEKVITDMNSRLLDVNNLVQLLLKRADFKYESLESFKESPISSNETLDFSTSMFVKYSGTEEESPNYTRYAEDMRNSINDVYERFMNVDDDEKSVCFKEIYNLSMKMSELLRRAEKDAAIALEKSKSGDCDQDRVVELENRVRDLKKGK